MPVCQRTTEIVPSFLRQEQVCVKTRNKWKEREQASKANEHQLQTIMSKMHSLKEKEDKDTTDRKVREKVLLDNIKASIDSILKSNFKSGDHISIGACLKGLQEEVNNYCPPMVNKQ